MMSDRLPCFKAYDIRGAVPEELNEGLPIVLAARSPNT